VTNPIVQLVEVLEQFTVVGNGPTFSDHYVEWIEEAEKALDTDVLNSGLLVSFLALLSAWQYATPAQQFTMGMNLVDTAEYLMAQ
jgi:hypothetical protein